jgi:hypothetical protein
MKILAQDAVAGTVQVNQLKPLWLLHKCMGPQNCLLHRHPRFRLNTIIASTYGKDGYISHR